jgi:AcrR family transcriptional regulator
MTSEAHEETVDRRVKRTRSAIVAAFNRLILDRGYAALTPGDVAAAADVGRSTFYEHYRGIDDLLATSLGAILGPLARGCLDAETEGEAESVLEHIWDNRRLAHALFNDEARPVVLRSFAAQFETALQPFIPLRAAKPMLAPELIALQLAAGQLAILGAWVSGRSGCSTQQIAAALRAGSRAYVLALTGADVAAADA